MNHGLVNLGTHSVERVAIRDVFRAEPGAAQRESIASGRRSGQRQSPGCADSQTAQGSLFPAGDDSAGQRGGERVARHSFRSCDVGCDGVCFFDGDHHVLRRDFATGVFRSPCAASGLRVLPGHQVVPIPALPDRQTNRHVAQRMAG